MVWHGSFFLVLALLLWRFSHLEAQSVPAVYVFGDSLVDVGNNNHLPVSIAKANFPHNGVDLPTKEPTGRFSNGKNAADFLAEKVGLPTSPPYLSLKSDKNKASLFRSGVSFASGGAGILNGTDQALGQSIPLSKQVDYYSAVYTNMLQELGSSGAHQHFSKSLFAIVIGSNDIFDYSRLSNREKKSTMEQYVTLMTSSLKGQLMRLYTYGARKFVFVGLGAIGCIPAQRIKSQTEECNEETSELSLKYNAGLKSLLEELKLEFKDIFYSYFDTHVVMQDIIENPAAHGFKEIKAACCGLGKLKAKIPCLPISKFCSNRSDHVFWDPFHPTEAVVQLLVNMIYDGPSQYTFPNNVKNLIAM